MLTDPLPVTVNVSVLLAWRRLCSKFSCTTRFTLLPKVSVKMFVLLMYDVECRGAARRVHLDGKHAVLRGVGVGCGHLEVLVDVTVRLRQDDVPVLKRPVVNCHGELLGSWVRPMRNLVRRSVRSAR